MMTGRGDFGQQGLGDYKNTNTFHTVILDVI